MSQAAPSMPETRHFVGLAREVIQGFSVLLRNAAMHDLSNEVFLEPLAELESTFRQIFANERGFRLEAIGQEFYANRTRIRMELRTLYAYGYLREQLARRGLGGFQIEQAPTSEQLAVLLSVLQRITHDDEGNVERIHGELAEREIAAIKTFPPSEDEGAGLSEEMALDRRRRAIHAYQQALDFIRETAHELESPSQVNLRRAKRAVQRLVDLSYEEGDGFSLVGLASIKEHDDYTFNHMLNVCVLSIAFGQRLGLDRAQLADLGLAALYHDMGKLHIPLAVLRSHGPLSDEQWALMGNHTVFGARDLYRLLAANPGTLNRILVALQHHFGFDHSGYPRIRILRQQRLYSRIVAICDAYDAMTTQRVYQKQFLPDEALGIIHQGSGQRYDPLLVKAFITCMGIYPPGATVLLSSGEVAVVVEASRDPERLDRPQVKLALDAARQPLPGTLVDLAQPEHSERSVLRCLDPAELGLNSPHFVV